MEVSVLLLTYNEASNLPRCLEALGWCDDIITVDSGSTDSTVEICEAKGVRILTRKFDNFANQRNYGLTEGHPKHQWVLHLDADEVVTSGFVEALQALLPPAGIDAYNVPSKTIFFGKWLRHAGMWPTYQVRLGDRDRLRFIQVGHGQREDLPPSRVATFEEPYLHYSFSHGLQRWLEKHVRYAEDEAGLIIQTRKSGNIDYLSGENTTSKRRKSKYISTKIPFFVRPVARFFYIYFIRQGFRDGKSGFVYAFMLSVYEGMMAILAYEKSRVDQGDRV